jgi:hypothetical protein
MTMSNCTYAGKTYSTGSVICQSGREKICKDDGTWEDLNNPCSDVDGHIIRSEEQSEVNDATPKDNSMVNLIYL